MCGICGFFNFQQKQLPAGKDTILKSMTQRIYHRGPDGEGFYFDKCTAMGMRRLAIIDLQTGEQPQFNEDNSIAVVFNGEIYNFKEIKRNLIAKNHHFRSESDTEVIPHLYEELGEDFVHQLNGMFAIALLDKREKKFLLIRDRLGIKPLYYSIVGNTLVFASELKSLLEFPGIKKELSLPAVYNYLTFECVSAPRTIFSHIHKLLPGEMAVAQHGKIRKTKYWQPHINKMTCSKGEIAEQIRETFLSAVKYRLISDVPLGVFLSGGMDSTLITGAASTFQANLKTFAIGFSEETFNELHYAKIASTHFNTNHQEMVLSYKKAIDLLPTIMNYLDEPLADASIIPTYLVSHLSRPNITVALSGDGGDELFLGYDTYKAYKVARFCRWMPRPLIRAAYSMSSLLPASSKRLSLEFKIKKFLSGLQHRPEYANYIWWGAYTPQQKGEIFSKESLAAIGSLPLFEPIDFYQEELKRIKNPLDRVNYLDLHIYLQDDLLPKVDRMSMANSLEVRVPFLDHRLVELAINIKNTLRMRGLKSKYILKKTMNEFIPPQLLNRPKIGFDIPLGPWLRHDLKDYMMDLLSRRNLKQHGIFNYQAVEHIINQHLQGSHNHRQLIWPLIIFQNWYNKYQPTMPG